jgi:hypothetical protein
MDAKQVVTGFFADIDAGDTAAAFARLAPDLVYRVVAPEQSGGGMFDLDGMQRNAMSVFEKLAAPLKLTVLRTVVEGEFVVAQTVSSAPTLAGGRYENSYLFLFRVVDGCIVEGVEYLDSAMLVSLLRQ